MNTIKNIAVGLIIFAALALVVYGVSKISEPIPIANNVVLEQIQDCSTIYWNETEYTYGTCTQKYNTTVCSDPPVNKTCHIEERQYDYICVISSKIVEKSKETCLPQKMEITIDKTVKQEKYLLDYGDWGKCSYSPGTDSGIIICDSNKDGNGDGVCQSGESCIAFFVSKDKIEKMYRNSGVDFEPDDVTFYQNKIDWEALQ